MCPLCVSPLHQQSLCVALIFAASFLLVPGFFLLQESRVWWADLSSTLGAL